MGSDFLVQHAKDKNNDIGFTDYSVHEPFDEKWKTNCKERISQTKGTIVLVGADTAKAEAVLWEIAETNRQDHSIFGVQINRRQDSPDSLGVAEQPRRPVGLRRHRQGAGTLGTGVILGSDGRG